MFLQTIQWKGLFIGKCIFSILVIPYLLSYCESEAVFIRNPWNMCVFSKKKKSGLLHEVSGRAWQQHCLCFPQVLVPVLTLSSLRVRWTLCSPSSPANGRGSALAIRSWKWWVTPLLLLFRLFFSGDATPRLFVSSVSACRRTAPCSRRCRPCRTSWTAWGQTTSNCTRRSSSCRATPAEYVATVAHWDMTFDFHSFVWQRNWNVGFLCRRLEVVMTQWCVTHPSMRRDWTHLPPSAGR